jgi:uncharacterized protein
MAVTKDEALAYLRASAERFAREFGVKRIGVFGSVVRGDTSASSDIDVLVDLEVPTFDRYMDLKFDLEREFGVPVDLVMRETLKERLRPAIEGETVYA